MKIPIFLLLVLVPALWTTFVSSQNVPKSECGKFVGMSTDGRSFFMEETTFMDWYDARAFCERCGLALGAIVTAEQNNFLVGALSNQSSTDQFWTSARESRSNLAYLAWDNPRETVQEGIFHNMADATGNLPYYVCGMYEVKNSTQQGWMVVKPCSFELATLCMVA